CNLLIRSQMLYSVELANQSCPFRFASAKLRHFFETAKFFHHFFPTFFLTLVDNPALLSREIQSTA
ncbi:MAG: hypothetical protein NC210_08345, partial [[Clostridium] fimetarium]|nr:hypothetical protein [[Clostridium] fimetarium]